MTILTLADTYGLNILVAALKTNNKKDILSIYRCLTPKAQRIASSKIKLLTNLKVCDIV